MRRRNGFGRSRRTAITPLLHAMLMRRNKAPCGSIQRPSVYAAATAARGKNFANRWRRQSLMRLPPPRRVTGRYQEFSFGKMIQAIFVLPHAALSCLRLSAAAHNRPQSPLPNMFDESWRSLRWRRRRGTRCEAGDFSDDPLTQSIERAFFRNCHSQTQYFPQPAPISLVQSVN